MIAKNPLEWPPGWPRTETRQAARFRTDALAAFHRIGDELERVGARDAVLTFGGAIGKRGALPLAAQPRVADPGVALYFDLGGGRRAMPCDRWLTVADNMQAVALTINALRGIERWGAEGTAAAAFAGFAALPAQTGGEAWWDVLKVSRHASPETTEHAYKMLAKEAHPDAGGDPERFHRLTEAYRQARAARGR